jgi:hypothetical protein
VYIRKVALSFGFLIRNFKVRIDILITNTDILKTTTPFDKKPYIVNTANIDTTE